MLTIVLMFYMFYIFMLMGVAFYTLLERHTLGLTQMRYGPKKTSIYGLLQPLLDGLKLISKEQILSYHMTPLVVILTSIFSFSLSLLEWVLLPLMAPISYVPLSYLVLMLLLGMKVYPIMLGGVYSKSKFAYIGGMRSTVASVSYEVVFSLVLLVLMMNNKSYNMLMMNNVGMLLLLPAFLISVTVELSRTPFDYVEGESELVSGYNTEYSGVGFVLFFLGEYSSIIFYSGLTSMFFFNGHILGWVMAYWGMILLRSSLPRVRYDKMMGFFWLNLVFFVSIMMWAIFMVSMM